MKHTVRIGADIPATPFSSRAEFVRIGAVDCASVCIPVNERASGNAEAQESFRDACAAGRVTGTREPSGCLGTRCPQRGQPGHGTCYLQLRLRAGSMGGHHPASGMRWLMTRRRHPDPSDAQLQSFLRAGSGRRRSRSKPPWRGTSLGGSRRDAVPRATRATAAGRYRRAHGGRQVGFLALDWALGEDGVTRWIGGFETSDTRPPAGVPADGLIATVEALADRAGAASLGSAEGRAGRCRCLGHARRSGQVGRPPVDGSALSTGAALRRPDTRGLARPKLT